MKKVLMIAYFFPPLGGAGVQRTLKFVKYLPKFGWDPIVLTQRGGHHFAFDYEQLKDIPKGTKVVRAKSLEAVKLRSLIKSALFRIFKIRAPGKTLESEGYFSISKRIPLLWWLRRLIENWIFIPDSKIRWFPAALLNGFRLAKYKDVKVIYSTSYPYTCHMVGYFIKRLTHKPWVVDFRDPWADNIYMTRHLSPLRKKIDRWLESEVIRSADSVILNTKSSYDSFVAKYASERTRNFSVITNGYDEDEFQGLPVEKTEKFTMAYTGVLSELTDPGCLFEALSQFARENPLIGSHLEVLFVGYMDEKYKGKIRALGLNDIVRTLHYVSRRECLRIIKRASVLILTLSQKTQGQGIFPYKIFDYLMSRRPVLALVPDDTAANLIRETNSGSVIDPIDKEAISEALLTFYKNFENHQLIPNPHPLPVEYSVQYLTGELASILNRINGRANNEYS